MDLINFAVLYFNGSLLKIPLTLVAFTINLQSNSEALKAAAVSVEKKGFPVPAANITILFLSRCHSYSGQSLTNF